MPVAIFDFAKKEDGTFLDTLFYYWDALVR